MKKFLVLMCVIFYFGLIFGCTIQAVGTEAMADGSTIVTHNDDSSSADFRLWIIPAMDWNEDATREIVINSHNYIDYGNYPNVDYGDNGLKMAEIPQISHTYSYLHSRYSFMNEVGVAMGESTFSISTRTDHGKEVRKVLYEDSYGIIDCWTAQDIALERATTAKEAVEIMGDLVEEFGWYGAGEIINVCDGNEVWIAEFYGLDLWVAFKLPEDAYFVGANTAMIQEYHPEDSENWMGSPNLISFAVEQGWYDPNSGEQFNPAAIYGPKSGTNIREWRALDIVAPSLNLEYGELYYPMYVIPDNKLTVNDIFEIAGDHYEGTEFDLTKGPGAGPWGDPLTNYRIAGRQRPIGIPLTCYLQIGQVKSWLPDPIKGITWFGYGSVGHSFITPLFPAMGNLPELYQNGSRYEEFRRDSGWWINTYVQEVVGSRYEKAIENLRNFRDPKMQSIYDTVPILQDAAAKLYEINPDAAIDLLGDYAYDTALGWYDDWLKLGDEIFARYACERINFGSNGYPDWWIELLETDVEIINN